jgi:hypothetical protein
MNAPGLDAGELLEIGDNGTEGMAIIRVSVQRSSSRATNWRAAKIGG